MANHEHIPHSPEHERVSPEELEKIGAERRNELHEKFKEQIEKQHETAEEAHEKALELAKEKESTKHEHERPASPAERRRGPISKKERDASFNNTMQEVRSQMSAPSRAFSKLIHNKAVEKTSEIVGGTVARPNALLSGAIFAFLLVLGVYFVAKNFGYPLSGFETIAAFVIGWLLGIAFDFVKIMVTGRK
jgi:hypothetical protein